MAEAAGARRRMERASLASVGIHLLVALAIPALAWTASTSAPVETVSFMHIMRIQVVPPPRPPAPPPRAVAPHHDVKPTISFANHIRTVAAAPRRHAPRTPVAATNAPAAPAVGAVTQAGTGTAPAAGAPDATPSPAIRAVSSTGTHRDGGYLPFGAQQPDPVLAAGVLKQLGALGAHVTLFVTVNEDGRTENVVFQPSIDPQLEARIRELLADASWDPAVCGGGVACEGRATIRL
jgi:hypothetical protein